MNPSVRRIFLGWGRPALVSAGEHLAGAFPPGEAIDLCATAVVVPGARAGRQLIATLVELAETRNAALSPPAVVTPGEIADLLLGPFGRPAGDVSRRLAWIDALRAAPPASLRPLLPTPPGQDDVRAWSGVAAMLARAHDELTGALLTFDDVPELAGVLFDGLDEEERWRAASDVQRRYEAVLGAWGLVDPGLARLRAVGDGAPTPRQRLLLLGVADLPGVARAAIERNKGAVDALVFAPERLADRFDALGCVVAGEWSEAPIDIDDRRIAVADRPSDQADAALAAIAILDGRYGPDQIVVGAADSQVTPHVARRGERFGVSIRPATGAPLRRSGPYRLLACVASYLDTESPEALAALVRHPDFEDAMLRGAKAPDGAPADGVEWWLDALDRERADHIPTRVTGRWRGRGTRPRLGPMLRAVNRLLAPLITRGGEAEVRPPIAWASPILAALRDAYAGRRWRRQAPGQRETVEACLLLREALGELGAVGEGASPVHAAEAIRLVLEIAADRRIAEPADETAIELLGWLEIALDPSPVAVLTGMNDGAVPASVSADPLLPDALRTRLGLVDDRRRHARDAYLLSAILASRDETAIVCGRRSEVDDPIAPSRLLFQCPDDVAARRLGRLFADDPGAPFGVRLDQRAGRATDRFVRAPVIDADVVESMRVTSFKRYLESPYLFYLEHVLDLEEVDDRARELDGAGFGSLIHEVLDGFGSGDVRHSTEPREIEARLLDGLTTIARVRHGDHPPAPLRLQFRFAEHRLRAFASWQAQRAREGWLIEEVEWRPPLDATPTLDVDGVPMGLRGRIDRIDRHAGDGRIAVLDYKTGDRAESPERTHRRAGAWRDLQLPLYRHLLGASDDERVGLGFVLLPRRPVTTLAMAGWDAEALRDADETARDVVRMVRRRRFEQIGDAWTPAGAIGALCGEGFLRRGGTTGEDADA